MAERVISERVVSRRVVGSANPILKKFRNFKGSITGVCVAPILMIIALGLLFYSEKFERSSITVESLSLEKATEVTADSGMHKMQGKVEVTAPAEAPEMGDVLYYTYKKQQYEEVEETETETVTKVENGQEIEEQVERVKLVEKWVDKESESNWGEFKLGKYTIKPSGANLRLDLNKKEYTEDFGMYEEVPAGRTVEPDIGDRRLVVEYLDLDTELLVVGEISGSTVSGGEVFIITTKGDSELLSDMKGEETAMYWIMKGGSWLLLTLGMLMILGPILSLLDFIPIAGQAANCAASIVAGIIAAVIVLMGTIIIKFWYVCIALAVLGVVGLVALLVFLVAKKGGKEEEKK
ncbi:hypothetical protein JW766_04405 [Candidatus Dojkabacteria bacterium]|nr:hypothetical protein [Candidatus Dojkabacteria bacterium]